MSRISGRGMARGARPGSNRSATNERAVIPSNRKWPEPGSSRRLRHWISRSRREGEHRPMDETSRTRWREVEEIVGAVLEVAATDRDASIDRLCAGRADL